MADVWRRQMNVLAWKLYNILIQISLKHIPNGTVDKKINEWENDLVLSTRQAIIRANECLVQWCTSAPVNIWYRTLRTKWFHSNLLQLIRMNLRITEAYIRHLQMRYHLDLVKTMVRYEVNIAWCEIILTWYAIIITLYAIPKPNNTIIMTKNAIIKF